MSERSERAITDYYYEILQVIERPDGPEQAMIIQAEKAKESWISMVISAANRGAVIDDIKKDVVDFEASVVNLPSAHFMQLFAEGFVEKFDGSNPLALAGYISQGARRAGHLYLSLELSMKKDGFTLDSIGKQWVLATTATKAPELGATLLDALRLLGKKVWQTNLPKSIDMTINTGTFTRIRASVICTSTREPSTRERCHIKGDYPIVLTPEQRATILKAWNDIKIQRAIQSVEMLEGKNEYKEF